MMKTLKHIAQVKPAIALLAGFAALGLAGCETGGTAGPGIGTAAGAAAGAGAGRLLFGNNTTGMLIGAAAGGLAGNMALDRQAETRRQQEREVARDAEMQRQLDFERQRALQAAETEREIENGGCSNNGSANARRRGRKLNAERGLRPLEEPRTM